MSPRRADAPAKGPWWATIVAGLLFGGGALIAAIFSGLISGELFSDQRGQVTWLNVVLGTFLTGCLFWWLIMAQSGRVSFWNGALTGAWVGLAAYPVVLTLADLFGYDGSWKTIGTHIVKILQLAALGIVTTGFAAALVMALVGGIAAWVLRPAYPAASATKKRNLWLRALGAIVTIVVALLTGAFIWLTLIPLQGEGIARPLPTAGPAPSYKEAMAAVEAVGAEEDTLPLDPRCKSTLLTHGAKTAQVVIFIHGLTNCPYQANEFAAELFELGYNVYLPRLPGHGEDDPMTLALASITAEQVVETIEGSIHLSRGLGDEVIVSGLSAGGVLTVWAAQYRSDVAHTVAMAPFMVPYGVPYWANRAATNLILMLPNIMMPWDPRDPLGPSELDYAYPRIASHAAGQFMRLGEIVGASAHQSAPLSQSLGMLLNEADNAINNDLPMRVATSWRDNGRTVDLEMFPQSEALVHDFIDPRQPLANTAAAYPVVIDMIGRRDADEATQ